MRLGPLAVGSLSLLLAPRTVRKRVLIGKKAIGLSRRKLACRGKPTLRTKGATDDEKARANVGADVWQSCRKMVPKGKF